MYSRRKINSNTISTLKITDTTNKYILIVKEQDEPLYEGKEGGWIQLDTYGPWVGDDKNVGCHENGKCIVEHYAQPREKLLVNVMKMLNLNILMVFSKPINPFTHKMSTVEFVM